MYNKLLNDVAKIEKTFLKSPIKNDWTILFKINKNTIDKFDLNFEKFKINNYKFVAEESITSNIKSEYVLTKFIKNNLVNKSVFLLPSNYLDWLYNIFAISGIDEVFEDISLIKTNNSFWDNKNHSSIWDYLDTKNIPVITTTFEEFITKATQAGISIEKITKKDLDQFGDLMNSVELLLKNDENFEPKSHEFHPQIKAVYSFNDLMDFKKKIEEFQEIFEKKEREFYKIKLLNGSEVDIKVRHFEESIIKNEIYTTHYKTIFRLVISSLYPKSVFEKIESRDERANNVWGSLKGVFKEINGKFDEVWNNIWNIASNTSAEEELDDWDD